MNLTITKEKILEASRRCPESDKLLKTLFPEVFDDGSYIPSPGDKFKIKGSDTIYARIWTNRIVKPIGKDSFIAIVYTGTAPICTGEVKEFDEHAGIYVKVD